MDNSNEHRKRWIAAHPELVAKPSMKRRKVGHDYCGVAIYLVTLCVEGRRPVLGTLNGPDERHVMPWVYPSQLGLAVKRAWQEIPQYHPQVRLLGFQLMPDHVHGIIHVTTPMPQPLGRLIQGFKKGCRDAMNAITPNGGTLWEEGYNDRILQSKGQLNTMFRYLKDNPRRLWIKRNHPDFFRTQQEVKIGDQIVAVMGNRFLLDNPNKVAAKCHRNMTAAEKERTIMRFLMMAQRGAVLVSPRISQGEKDVMDMIQAAGFPFIQLLENGFSPMWKPGGEMFDACASGQVLLVAPWPYHTDRHAITRDQCLFLNDLAALICSQR